MVLWLSVRTHNVGVVSSNSTCVIRKALWMRKATGNHLIKSTFPAKLRALSLVSATLEIEYAMQDF